MAAAAAAAALSSSTGRGRHLLLPAASARMRDCRVPLLLLRGWFSPAGARVQRDTSSSTTISGPSGDDDALAVSCLCCSFTSSHLALSSVCVAASLPAAAGLGGLGELVSEEAMLALGDELLDEPECGGILHCSSPMVEADGVDGESGRGSGGGTATSFMVGTTAARVVVGGGGGTSSLMTGTAG